MRWNDAALDFSYFRSDIQRTGELISYVSEHGFIPQKHSILYGGLMPLCFLKAKKK